MKPLTQLQPNKIQICSIQELVLLFVSILKQEAQYKECTFYHMLPEL